ncbi:MAG: Do family serine endopeptidase [Treponema sp.]|nr:Do family serine endopeptidase [Treponema sp.]
MNKSIKILGATALLFLLSTSLFAQTSKKSNSSESAQALSVVESFQTVFRDISDMLLPSVVEVDVTETKTVTYTNPFESFGFPFGDFFGFPEEEDEGKSKKNQREYEQKGLGSGVIVRRVNNTYYVLTNNHVAGSASKITVKLNDGREYEGKLVGTDERIDIALVSFEAKKDKSIPVANLGDSDNVKPGDICMAFGAPLGFSQSVTQGIISAVNRSESSMSSISDYIQTDAAINQGNSGGPLVNIYGQVIGINTWIASSSGGSVGLGFAIPINNIKKSIDSLIDHGKIIYGWVGVSLIEINDDYKEDLKVDNLDGAFAVEVFTNSPAFKGGLKPGDFIVTINGKLVNNVSQLVREVGSLEAGTIAKFGVIRGGIRIPDISVKVEERAKDSEIQNNKMWPGFIAYPLTDEVRKQYSIDKNIKGVIATNVEAKSPAASLGIGKGNIITAVNGVKVTNLSEFYGELAKATKGVNFDLYVDGNTIQTGTYIF